MPMGNAAKTALFTLLVNNADWTGIGDAGGIRGSVVAGSYFMALHTASPGAAGSQTTSEATYGAYARVGVVRTAAGWTVSGTAPTQFTNVAAITFPQSSGTTNTITDASLGSATSGAGQISFYGTLATPVGGLIVNTGIFPSFPIGNAIFTVT